MSRGVPGKRGVPDDGLWVSGFRTTAQITDGHGLVRTEGSETQIAVDRRTLAGIRMGKK